MIFCMKPSISRIAIGAGICASALFAYSSIAFADNATGTASTTTSSKATTTKPHGVDARGNFRTNIQERVEDIKERASVNRDERNREIFDKAEERKIIRDIGGDVRNKSRIVEFTVSINNLQDISERAGQRIVKLKALGASTTEAERLLALSKTQITTAKTALAGFIAFSTSTRPTTGTATSTATSTNEVKRQTFITTIKKSIEDARKNLRLAVVAIDFAGKNIHSPKNK
jgi:hypothetical protein